MEQEMKIKEFLQNVVAGKENIIEVTKELSPEDGKTMVLKFSQPVLEPIRAESKARNHTFTNVGGFVKYLQKYGTKNTVVLADISSRKIVAVLDEISDKGREIVTFTPQIYPLLELWFLLIKAAKFVQIRDAADFLLANRRSLPVEVGGLLLIFNQIKISKSVTVQTGQGPRSINGVMVETVIQGQVKNELVEIPEFIVIDIPLFVGTDPEDVEVDLTVREIDDNKVGVLFSSSDLEIKMLEAFEKMLLEIGQQLESADMLCGMGTLDYREWDYIK